MGSGADTRQAELIGVDAKQVAGNHYKTGNPAQQHWNLAVDLNWNYLQAQVIKYMMRYRDKNGLQDLEKAKHFLEKLIEVERRGVPAGKTYDYKRSIDTVFPELKP